MNETLSKEKGTWLGKRANPEFRDFVNQKLQSLKAIIRDFRDSTSETDKIQYAPKFSEILTDINSIQEKFKTYSTKFKYYTGDTEKSLRKLAFLTKELLNELIFSQEMYENEKKEIHALNVINQWGNYHSNVKELYYYIENSNYPYTIHTVFSLAFVLVPFLNLFSLVGGIYLITHKDWRALAFGIIVLVLFFSQMVNLAYLVIFA